MVERGMLLSLFLWGLGACAIDPTVELPRVTVVGADPGTGNVLSARVTVDVEAADSLLVRFDRMDAESAGWDSTPVVTATPRISGVCVGTVRAGDRVCQGEMCCVAVVRLFLCL